MEYVKDTWTIEHSWRCTSCNHDNAGSEEKCLECGKPIDSKQEEIIPKDMSKKASVELSGSQKAKEVFLNKKPGKDWVCVYCKHRAFSFHSVCPECGAKQEISKPAEKTRDERLRERFDKETQTLFIQDLSPRQPVETTQKKKKEIPLTSNPAEDHYQEIEEIKEKIRKDHNNSVIFLKITLSIIVMLILAWLFYYFFSWHNTTGTITETTWHYHVSLRERRIYQGHDWRNEMKNYHFNESCHQEIRSYHNCDPYSCNPHPVSYSCNCQTISIPRESCNTVCSNNGNRSSTCRNVCSTYISSRTSCSTCYRTEFDTCYHRCPDYDDMCSYSYPAWPEIRHMDNWQHDHTIIRPNLSSLTNDSCGSNPEILFMGNRNSTQCTEDSLEFFVRFNVPNVGEFTTNPSVISQYHRFHSGSVWDIRYNHAGMFQPISPRRN